MLNPAWSGITTKIKTKYKISTTRKMNELIVLYSSPAEFEEVFRENPYDVAINTLNKTFKQADDLVLSLYPEFETSLSRCRWCCWDILKKNENNGHTRMSDTELAKAIWKDYPAVKQHILEAVTKTENMFHYDANNRVVSFIWTYRHEQNIANNIIRRVKNPEVMDIKWQNYTNVDGFELTDEQKKILELVCKNNIVMLNGSAGTGKTSAMKAMVKMIEDNGRYCTILAPTGIAAKRIAEVTGHEASTIHRHLASDNGFGDFLIVDEMSMVGVSLLSNLLSAARDYEPKIIFVCDEAQLASISCGNIVQDIVDSGIIPIVNLTKVFRYGIGGIATVATDVRNGVPLKPNMQFNDFVYINPKGKTINSVMETYDALKQSYNTEDIMILSPFAVREAGTLAINKAIQNKYNDAPNVFTYKRSNTDIDFKIGDRIINTENNYHMSGEDFEDIAIMNGEYGKIVDYNRFDNILAVDYESGRAYLEKADIYKQLLGYAITIHKSQGSQSKAVIVVVDKSQSFFLTRNLIYVALSRAQEKLILIGDIEAINGCLNIEENKRRNTWLKEMLTI